MIEISRKTAGRQKLFDLLKQNIIPIDAFEPATRSIWMLSSGNLVQSAQMSDEKKVTDIRDLATFDTFDFSSPARENVDMLYKRS